MQELYRRYIPATKNDVFLYSDSPSGLSLLSNVARVFRTTLRIQPDSYTNIPISTSTINISDLASYFPASSIFKLAMAIQLEPTC